MRLNLILPKVEPNQFEFPKKCPQKGCRGMRFIPRQEVSKKIIDAQHPNVGFVQPGHKVLKSSKMCIF